MTLNNFEGLSLLIVEGSPGDVFLVKEAMKEAGLSCRLEFADDGEKASGSWTT